MQFLLGCIIFERHFCHYRGYLLTGVIAVTAAVMQSFRLHCPKPEHCYFCYCLIGGNYRCRRLHCPKVQTRHYCCLMEFSVCHCPKSVFVQIVVLIHSALIQQVWFPPMELMMSALNYFLPSVLRIEHLSVHYCRWAYSAPMMTAYCSLLQKELMFAHFSEFLSYFCPLNYLPTDALPH